MFTCEECKEWFYMLEQDKRHHKEGKCEAPVESIEALDCGELAC